MLFHTKFILIEQFDNIKNKPTKAVKQRLEDRGK